MSLKHMARVTAWAVAWACSGFLMSGPGAVAAVHSSSSSATREAGPPQSHAETPVPLATPASAVGRVFELADARLAVMPAVAAVKWKTHAPIYDPPRESAVIQRAKDLAAPMGLAGAAIGRLFELQARLAREVQGRLHAQWQANGFADQGPATTLAELRPRLDGLTIALLQAIYVAAPELQQPDFATRYDALAEQALHSDGWSGEGRRELLAQLAQIRRTPVPVLQRIAATGVLRVGTTGDYAPFSVEANGSVSGADIELAEELAQKLHARPVFVRTSWSGLLDDLQRDEFDLVFSGVTITPSREAQGAFSLPYASGGKTAIARCTDVAKFGDLRAIDRSPVRVIVNPGGTNEQYVRANLHQAQVVVFPDNRAIFDEIVAGRADVMVTDDVEVELQTRRHHELCRPFAALLTHAQKAIFLPRDAEWQRSLNSWLAEAIAAGEPARLLKSYLQR